MPNTTIELRSSGSTGNTPSLGVLANGELAINRADGILYYKSSSNTLGSIRTTQPAGLTTEVQFNDAGSFGTDANFTFNKSTDILTVVGGVIAAGTNVAPALAANAAYSAAAFALANTANITADASFSKANTANITADASFSKANAANVLAQAAFDKANQTAQLAFTTVSANGTSLIADANNDTLTITANTANGIEILSNSSTDTLDLGLKSSGATAATYGNSTTALTITVDRFGRITSISSTATGLAANTTITTPVLSGQTTANGSIIPGANTTYDLGSANLRWANIYTGDLHLSNEGRDAGNLVDGTKGNWTVQEGETDLYLINNRTGKKYRFAVEEIIRHLGFKTSNVAIPESDPLSLAYAIALG